jgi:uncharacterized membrane protein YfcA
MIFIEHSFLAQHFLMGLFITSCICFMAGYIDSIAGGGGLITTPTFLIMGFPPQNALAQSKLVNSLGTMIAIRNFAKNKCIIWKVVPLGTIFALLGALIGSKIVLIIKTQILYYLIAVLIPFGFLFTIYKSKLINKEHDQDFKFSPFKIIIVCLLVGFYDGFFGPGTGSIFIICLYLITKMPLINASATSKTLNLSSNIGAFIIFLLAGKMSFVIGIPMILANIIGNHLGSSRAIQTNGKIISKVLLISVSFLLMSLLVKFFF